MEVNVRVRSGPHQGQEHLIKGSGTLVVGRSSQAPLSMHEDRLLSREHFQVEVNPPLCIVRDLGSKNGTKVNGLRVEVAQLRDGDVIAAGESEFAVHVEEESFGEASRPRCAACGREIKEQRDDEKLCPACVALRARFPKTDPDFLIERRIGGGGMGEVYLARQLSQNRPVAIKMMIPTGAAPRKAKEYFRREIQVMRNLLMPSGRCHSNIVAFYDIHEIDGQFQLIMEYFAGKNALEWAAGVSVGTRPTTPTNSHRDTVSELTQRIATPLPVGTVARLGKLLLAGLDYAHGLGIIHRDVKPSNILVMGPVERPSVKLSDFGLAKSFRDNAAFTPLTHQGDIGGSIGFLSPDHIRDFSHMKECADIYSAGVTLYYLLTHQYPYLGFNTTNGEAYSMILEHPAVPLRVHRPDAPEGLDRVLRKAMEKEPRDRWKSAAAMGEALRAFVEPGT
jgi:serine/threonine-protein kinase